MQSLDRPDDQRHNLNSKRGGSGKAELGYGADGAVVGMPAAARLHYTFAGAVKPIWVRRILVAADVEGDGGEVRLRSSLRNRSLLLALTPPPLASAYARLIRTSGGLWLFSDVALAGHQESMSPGGWSRCALSASWRLAQAMCLSRRAFFVSSVQQIMLFSSYMRCDSAYLWRPPTGAGCHLWHGSVDKGRLVVNEFPCYSFLISRAPCGRVKNHLDHQAEQTPSTPNKHDLDRDTMVPFELLLVGLAQLSHAAWTAPTYPHDGSDLFSFVSVR